ncbi:helix-turn-helix domain-containing protein [Desulfosudis oleivorans]|uniref:Transcriptional regulator, XRE family n=1 Tax=Desulfosudis oleivorans (strain DSM 6200 / JCM 39069 / Hxd3) TaxID=96561 RepID=A8ZWD8_DESOH|nr:helix-turn-helix transcriptional regulator [Desulfosudis oleivorans]ABW66746.1 transcriptional regulator, XRE family [Desulfosudis oleivorans Hxd3]
MKKEPLKKSSEYSIEELFGNALKQIRKRKGFSQEELGLESGYHRTYISLLERGKKSPSLKTIFRLAETLQVKPSELIKLIEKDR